MRDREQEEVRAGDGAQARSRMRWLLIAAAVSVLMVFLFWPEAATHEAVSEHGSAEAVSSEQQLYSCGMHPQFIAEEPGQCPVCGMRLTPMKGEAASKTQTAPAGERRITHWRAPMDPSFVSDKPGKSPMGMDLVPVYEDEAGEEAGSAISISPVVVQNMGVRTGKVERRKLERTIRTVGTLDYDERLVRDVTTKFDGWIEELYADYTGQHIERGMPLFRVYSRELYSSQEEYLLALRNRNSVSAEVLPEAAAGMEGLARSARKRLELFDVSMEQIRELAARGAPTKTLKILSPHTGVIVEKNARDGMHVTPGSKLYTIADLSRVWVYVDIYENEAPFVKIGQEAAMELSYLPGEVFRGKVIYVYPFVDTNTRTIKVRLEFENPHILLKPGMFADVRISTDLRRRGLTVPRAAVIDTGQRQLAFVALGGGRFEPRDVRVGLDLGDDHVEILSGLDEGEEVVTSGQFLLDSESKLREAVAKMVARKAAESGSEEHGGGENLEAVGRSRVAAGGVEQEIKPASGAGQADVFAAAPELAGPAAPVLARYLEIQKRLARDDYENVQAAVTALEAPLAGLSAAADGLQGGANASGSKAVAVGAARSHAAAARAALTHMQGASTDVVRAQFVDLSRHMIALLRLVGPDNADPELRVIYCPMAGGEWIQEGEEPANPYYGASMLRCGEPVALRPSAE